MAQLFGIDKSGISRHINNIFKEGELQQDTTVAIFATVVNRRIRGEVKESVDFYNLDMIIAVVGSSCAIFMHNCFILQSFLPD